jgi:hypothetical protein
MSDCPCPPEDLSPGTPPAPAVPCTAPLLPETEPIAFVSGLCSADGRPISLAYAPGKPNNLPCPPVAGVPTLPGYIGWIDVTVDPSIVIPGPPPAGVSACVGRFDFELAGVWCVVDVDGTPVPPFSVLWEVQRDEVTGAITGGQWVVPPTGAPFSPSATQFVKRCDPASSALRHERFEGCYLLDGVSYYGIRFAQWDASLSIFVTSIITDPDGTAVSPMVWPSFTTDCCC